MKALVIGAGVGGLSAGLALRELSGAEVRIFERAPHLDAITVGIGMVIWPNGMHALRQLGLEPAGHRIDRLEFFAAGGRRLNAWEVGALGTRLGAPSQALSRGELHRALAETYGAERIAFGAEYVGHSEDADGVTVTFADGRTERGDVLIGADGIVSKIRRTLTGQGPPDFPPYAGYTIWHAIIDHPAEDVPPNVFTLLFGRGHRFAHYRIDERRVYWSGIGFVEPGNEKI